MAWTLLAAGFCFFIDHQKTEVALVSLFIFLFAGVFHRILKQMNMNVDCPQSFLFSG